MHFSSNFPQLVNKDTRERRSILNEADLWQVMAKVKEIWISSFAICCPEWIKVLNHVRVLKLLTHRLTKDFLLNILPLGIHIYYLEMWVNDACGFDCFDGGRCRFHFWENLQDLVTRLSVSRLMMRLDTSGGWFLKQGIRRSLPDLWIECIEVEERHVPYSFCVHFVLRPHQLRAATQAALKREMQSSDLVRLVWSFVENFSS